MIEIKDATQDDNIALIELQKKCPMGRSLILQFDSTPNYFNRSRHQNENHIIVAVEDDKIVGSASTSIMEKRVCENTFRTAYHYGLMVDPSYRQRGIATMLTERREQIASENDVDMIFTQITQGNTASVRVQEKRGFKHIKDTITYLLMVYKPQKPSNERVIRPATETDLPRIVELVNDTHKDYDLYKPLSVDEFNNLIEKRAFYSINNIIISEKNGQINACLGYWDHNKIMQLKVLQYARKEQILSYALGILGILTRMPKIPKPGQFFNQYFLQDVGFTDPEHLTELVKYVNNIALKNDVRFLSMLGVEEPITGILSKFMNIKSTEHIYAKPLKQLDLTGFGQNKIFLSME